MQPSAPTPPSRRKPKRICAGSPRPASSPASCSSRRTESRSSSRPTASPIATSTCRTGRTRSSTSARSTRSSRRSPSRQLASQGKLALSDTVRRHLPDYPSPAADRITIQELADDVVRPRRLLRREVRRDAEGAPARAVGLPLRFSPTSRCSSSQEPAGAIRTRATSSSASSSRRLRVRRYHDYVREHVFRPAGMKDSDAYPQDAVVPNRAVGYTRDEEGGRAKGPAGPPRVNIYALPARSSSAGGGYTTAADLLAFDEAMRPTGSCRPLDRLVLHRQVEASRGGAAAEAPGRGRFRRRDRGRQRRHRDRSRHRLHGDRALEPGSASAEKVARSCGAGWVELARRHTFRFSSISVHM